MRVLHTSDWHLGRVFFGRKTDHESELFLEWLLKCIAWEKVDVFVLSGDVFDTTTPSHAAQQMYFRFLASLPSTGCQHAVVVAGNHDSPSLLDAHRPLAQALNIHVVGSFSHPENQRVLPLKCRNGEQVLVAALPHFRDAELRESESGETWEAKAHKVQEGLKARYREAAQKVLDWRRDTGLSHVPALATGHLFASGGSTTEGDGVRELYVGNLGQVDASAFPDAFDYVALGHLHTPQKVGGQNRIRYSGAPFHMGFSELGRHKSIFLVDLMSAGQDPTVQECEVPLFQKRASWKGTWAQLQQRLQQAVEGKQDIWLELIFDGQDNPGKMREKIQNLTADSVAQVLRFRETPRPVEAGSADLPTPLNLEDFSPPLVFDLCLDAKGVSPESRPALKEAFQEILHKHAQSDPQAK